MRGWLGFGVVPRTMRVVWAVAVGCALSSGADSVRAVAPPGGTLDALVQTGEFGPALAAVQNLPDSDQRDAWYTRIAAMQARSGASTAARDTLRRIASDQQRSLALKTLGTPSPDAPGAAGGAAMADFDTLIELITSTIAPDSWDEVGGAGAIEPFPTGVYVDASGVMKRLGPATDALLLESVRRAAATDSGNRNVRRTTALRKVSLVRLERELQLRHAFGQPPEEAMRRLAGLYRVAYLFVYPQTGDIVVAGPAGDWHQDAEGRVVNTETGVPVLQLDDLVVVLRNAFEQNGRFGCTINPRPENLAATKAYAEASRNRPIKPSQRNAWLEQLRSTLGQQDIKVWGIDPQTRTARVLVEADHRMKLVGMGLEEGTLGVESYLSAVRRAGGEPPPMNVLRWWFTLNYDGIRTTADRTTFCLDGQGVKVLSENELLTDTGDRIHTGTSDELTSAFARSFTRHFAALAAKYPIYAELRNVFDLALLAGILQSHDLPGQVDWHLTHFRDPAGYQVARSPQPTCVDSVINAVTIDRRRFCAGVSGGVAVDTRELVRPQAVRVDDYGRLDASHAAAQPHDVPADSDLWWWD